MSERKGYFGERKGDPGGNEGDPGEMHGTKKDKATQIKEKGKTNIILHETTTEGMKWGLQKGKVNEMKILTEARPERAEMERLEGRQPYGLASFQGKGEQQIGTTQDAHPPREVPSSTATYEDDDRGWTVVSRRKRRTYTKERPHANYIHSFLEQKNLRLKINSFNVCKKAISESFAGIRNDASNATK